MTLETIAAVASTAMVDPVALPAQQNIAPPAEGFAAWFAQEVGNVNAALATADSDVRKLAAGETQSLHEVMMHMEEAKLSFQLLAQGRNRLLEAYQEVMRMQI